MRSVLASGDVVPTRVLGMDAVGDPFHHLQQLGPNLLGGFAFQTFHCVNPGHTPSCLT